jgi:hypothetical protein
MTSRWWAWVSSGQGGPGGQPTRQEIRRAAQHVFARPEYQHHKGLLQRFIDWLRSLLPSGPRGPGTFSPAAELILYLGLLTAVVVLVVLVVMVVRSIRRRPRKDVADDVETTIEPEIERTVAEWRSEAERAEAEGRWKDALLCRYRELVGELVERDALPAVPGLTTGELRAGLAEVVPAASADFDAATTIFELAWYADAPTDERDNRVFHERSALVLEITPARVRRGAEPDSVVVTELEEVGS